LRVLRPGGTLFVIDWEDAFGGIGPSADMVFNKDKAKEVFSQAGFVLEREVATGSHHYGIIFSKPL
jgi:predicted methyltransferase